MKNLTDFIYHFAESKPNFPFIIHGDYKITFQKAAEQISSISNELLNAGLKSGKTVGILLQNCPEFVLTYLAVLNTGAVASLLPWTMPEGEVATLATTTRIDFLIYSIEFQEHADQILNLSGHPIKCYVHGRDSDESATNIYDFINNNISFNIPSTAKTRYNAVILFSAGDYSHPKSLVYTHENLINTALAVSERFPENYRFRIYTSLPYFHYFPFTLVVNLAIVMGNTIVIPFDDSREKLYESIQTHNVNIFVSNSGFIKELVSEKYLEPEKLKSIDYFIPVGDSFSMDTKNIIFRRYNAHIIEAYGVAEAPVITMNFNRNKINTASIGKSLSCCEMKIVDEYENEVRDNEPGFLLVRGNNVFHHYFDRYPIIERDREEWINTGDVAMKDEEGYLFWVCKQSDWISRNGFRINPESILSVVQKHPDIKEATVFNLKLSHGHDQIKLAVTVTDNPDFSDQELMSYCQSQLPKYLAPDSIEVVDHFDRNCIGIIRKSHITFQEH
ncbi:MAG: class I adenylate-forming enzyme family protein [Candidatus Marinimicrobia bacterium]|nr:class I adenylate-forming enzyme family protein [Candidatus Neomarinimicrobiota bacterium]